MYSVARNKMLHCCLQFSLSEFKTQNCAIYLEFGICCITAAGYNTIHVLLVQFCDKLCQIRNNNMCCHFSRTRLPPAAAFAQTHYAPRNTLRQVSGRILNYACIPSTLNRYDRGAQIKYGHPV